MRFMIEKFYDKDRDWTRMTPPYVPTSVRIALLGAESDAEREALITACRADMTHELELIDFANGDILFKGMCKEPKDQTAESHLEAVEWANNLPEQDEDDDNGLSKRGASVDGLRFRKRGEDWVTVKLPQNK